jgi:hypothetical protein
MEQSPELRSPLPIRPAAPRMEAELPPWPPIPPQEQVIDVGNADQAIPPLPAQQRAPIPVEYRQPFESTTYESASHSVDPVSVAPKPPPQSQPLPSDIGEPVVAPPASYVGRHHAGHHVPGHRAADTLPYVGSHRLALQRPDYVSPSEWLQMDDNQRRQRTPAWWLTPSGALLPPATSSSVLPPVPVLLPEIPIFDSVAADMTGQADDAQPKPTPESAAKPPVRPGAPPLPIDPQIDTDPNAKAVVLPAAAAAAGGRLGAAAWLGARYQRARNWFSDPEKGKRRKVTAAMLGGVALAATAAGIYLAARGHGVHHPGTGRFLPAGPATAPHTVLPPPATLTLTPRSDTIWQGVLSYAAEHGVHFTPAQEGIKQHIVGQVLSDNHQTWRSARNLPVGYQFVITPERAQQILGYR